MLYKKEFTEPSKNGMIKLSCIIVNYRTPDYLLDCLPGLITELDDIDAIITIVDNHSGDDSVKKIGEWVRSNNLQNKVCIIESPTNAGFASGNNIGIRSINAEYYLLLNSDTLIRSGAIKKLLDTAEKYPDAGLVSPRLEWPDGKGQESCFRYPSPISEMCQASQTGILERIFSKHVVPLPLQNEISFPQWTSFACVLIRGKVFQEIGLLDEGYFMYFEDIEYCHRANKSGWYVVHTPDARVVHLRGGSSPVKEQTRLRKRVPRYYYESRARFFYQTYGWSGLTISNILWIAGRSISKTRQILGRLDKQAIERQWLDIWINWINPLKPYALTKN